MRRISALMISLLFPAILLFTACGDDDSPLGAKDDREPLATTPQEFVAVFETAYNNFDLETYAALLDEAYTFHFLPDAGHPKTERVWGRGEELITTENMFTGATTYDSISVIRIIMDLYYQGAVTETLGVDDSGSPIIIHNMTAEVDMAVVTNDPRASDGSGIVNRVVFSTQDFTLRPDPDVENNLLLAIQYDREPISKKGASDHGGDTGSWGEVKSVMRYARNQKTETSMRKALEEEFVTAWEEMDSTAYAALLAGLYQFESLDGDPADKGGTEIWDREEELQIAGRIFGGWETADHMQVKSIDLSQRTLEISPNHDSFSGRTSADDWFNVTTEITLTVVVDDTSQSDGMGIINYYLDGDQEYVMQPGVDGSDQWLIRRQIDRDPNFFKDGLPEEPSWSEIKSLFRDEEGTHVASAVEQLLEDDFVTAYNSMDSAAYRATLDSLYEFVLLADTMDMIDERWTLAEELRIAGRMFSGWANENAVKVLAIDLDLEVLGQDVSNDFFPDKPEGDTWYKLTSEIDLEVLTQDPSASDGGGIINRIVYSNQDFIVRPDPDDTDSWVIRRQTDRYSITKTAGRVPGGSPEEASWGEIKSLFQ